MTGQVARASVALIEVTRRGAAFEGGVGLRFWVPVASVVVSVLLVDLLREVFPAGGVFLLLLVPVVVASLALGTASGLLALVLGVVGAAIVAGVRAHPWLSEPTDLLRVVPYLWIGGFIVLLASVLRASVRRPTRGLPATRLRLVEPLTTREAEILGLAASGLSTHEIAERLCLSRNTVKSHLTHAYGKLGARNRAEAVAMGLHAGALDRDAVVARVHEMAGAVAEPVCEPGLALRSARTSTVD
jgi:DNA-binding CsgD family transcriptional regulator